MGVLLRVCFREGTIIGACTGQLVNDYTIKRMCKWSCHIWYIIGFTLYSEIEAHLNRERDKSKKLTTSESDILDHSRLKIERGIKPRCSGVTTGSADPASGGGTLGGGKICLKYGTFFANLTKVLAKICVCARNWAFFRFHLDFGNFAKIRWLNNYFMHFVSSSEGAANWPAGGVAKPNVSPLCLMVINPHFNGKEKFVTSETTLVRFLVQF